LGLGGFVANDSNGAEIEVEGPDQVLDTFTTQLREQLPPLARITQLRERAVPPRRQRDFSIKVSRRDTTQEAEITPDAAVCKDCLRELFDANDRRYHYPFINCTNCGPRYSIIQSIPYDRPNTTMAKFRMCPACQAEYDDPLDRRFHAQPNACPVCGPRVWLTDACGCEEEGDAITRAAELLKGGRIVAVKGIGGFHLACRADIDEPVRRLRSRKQRET
ncbi:MAG: carbamoyltransferase HypF, partial [Gemmatimonadales bacterium]|nr:carbamoyltransferase HypF [Gemmatimonadales bacterium]